MTNKTTNENYSKLFKTKKSMLISVIGLGVVIALVVLMLVVRSNLNKAKPEVTPTVTTSQPVSSAPVVSVPDIIIPEVVNAPAPSAPNEFKVEKQEEQELKFKLDEQVKAPVIKDEKDYETGVTNQPFKHEVNTTDPFTGEQRKDGDTCKDPFDGETLTWKNGNWCADKPSGSNDLPTDMTPEEALAAVGGVAKDIGD